MRGLLGLIVVLARRDLSKDTELLVLRHENAVLRRQVARVPYTPVDRAWLAALSRLLSRRRWAAIFPVTPATILAWHRQRVSRKGDTPHVVDLEAHPLRRRSQAWSFGWLPRIPPGGTGACRANWSGSVVASPPPRCGRFSHDAGLDPAPRRSGPTWRQFLTASAKAVLAVDFLHVDTVFLTRIYALIAVEHGSRRAYLIGVSAHPTGAWTTQAARNLLIDLGDHVATMKFLLRDRDSRFTGVFDAVFAAEGLRILASPSGAPRANAIGERMIGTLRRELLDRILIVNERHLRRILTV